MQWLEEDKMWAGMAKTTDKAGFEKILRNALLP